MVKVLMSATPLLIVRTTLSASLVSREVAIYEMQGVIVLSAINVCSVPDVDSSGQSCLEDF
jgi:hypothetical protein